MARKLTLTPVVDPSAAIRGFNAISGAAGHTSSALAGVATKGKTSFSGLATAMNATGLTAQFGELSGLVATVGGGLTSMGDTGRISFGKIATGVGIGISALAGAGQALASPLQQSHAQLDKAITNAHEKVKNFETPIAATDKRMQGLGFTYADTEESLAKLTMGLGSAKKALAEEGLVADIASFKHQSLADAASNVVRAHAGNTRMLKEYGINVSANTKIGKEAEKDEKAHVKTYLEALAARKALADLEARLGATTGTKAASGQAAVASATDALVAARSRQHAVETRIATTPKMNAATAAAELASAQDSVTKATDRLDGARAKANSSGNLTVAQQQELARAQQKVADTQTVAGWAAAQAAKSQGDLGKAHLTGAQILDMVSKKVHGFAQVSADTFGGKIRAWKATITDFGEVQGEKFAKPLIALGPALAATGLLIEAGFFSKIGRGLKFLVTGSGQAAKALAGIGGSSASTSAAKTLGTSASRKVAATATTIGTSATGAVGSEATTVTFAGAVDTFAAAVTEFAAGSRVPGGIPGLPGGKGPKALRKTDLLIKDAETAATDAAGVTGAAGLVGKSRWARMGGRFARFGRNFAGWGGAEEEFAGYAPGAPLAALGAIYGVGYGAQKLAAWSSAKTPGGSIFDALTGAQTRVNGHIMVTPQQIAAANAAAARQHRTGPQATEPAGTVHRGLPSWQHARDLPVSAAALARQHLQHAISVSDRTFGAVGADKSRLAQLGAHGGDQAKASQTLDRLEKKLATEKTAGASAGSIHNTEKAISATKQHLADIKSITGKLHADVAKEKTADDILKRLYATTPQALGGNAPNARKMATGGVVSPTPGGTLIRVAEAGRAEVVAPVETSSTIHYHEHVHVNGGTFLTQDMTSFKRQMMAEQRRANFAGVGAGSGDL